MSKLHVKQIEGYIESNLSPYIDMSDYDSHKDKSEKKKAFLSRGLAVLAVALLTKQDVADISKSIVDGQKDGGLDIIYFDAPNSQLYLVQSKWHGDGHGTIDKGDMSLFVDGVRKVLDDDLDQLNDKVKSCKPFIKTALYNADSHFNLVIVHTGVEELSNEVSSVIDSFVVSHNDTSEIMSKTVLAQQQIHKFAAEGVFGQPINLDVSLSSWGQVREPHFAVYGQISTSEVASWYKTYGGALFANNIRNFIGVTPINQDIIGTLTTFPENFIYFNNGITATAKKIAKKPLFGNKTDFGIFECSSVTIVNGAQTVGSIAKAHEVNSEKAEIAIAFIRIITTEDGEESFGRDVTKNTNTQNAIGRREFVALDKEQLRIQQELKFDGVEYNFKSGSSSGAAKQFDLEEATIALACSDSDVTLAVQAKREIGKLWEHIDRAPYRKLFNGGLGGPYLWELVQTSRAIEAIISNAANNKIGREAPICIHGNRFIQWNVFKKFEITKDFHFDQIKDGIENAVCECVNIVITSVKADFPDSYPASLFKNSTKCRELATSTKSN